MAEGSEGVARLPTDAIPHMAYEVKRANLTYLSAEKFLSLYQCIRRVREGSVDGDFAEFGVALGGSGICIATEMGAGRSFHGFDVFGMIPPPSQVDGDGPAARYDEIKSGRSPGIGGDTYYGYIENLYDVVKGNFERFGVPADNRRVRLIKGLFADTLPKAELPAIALAHIDCDWYEPVGLCLRYCYERLSRGGLIILDDYNDWGGCRRATDEFCSVHSDVAMIRTVPHAVLARRDIGRA